MSKSCKRIPADRGVLLRYLIVIQGKEIGVVVLITWLIMPFLVKALKPWLYKVAPNDHGKQIQ
jgi:antibiotic biosynthesis monooxygenase (ABM) superfamily enzyme